MTDAPNLQLLLVTFGAVLFGVLVTVLSQAAASFRALTRELTETSRHVREVAESLQPVAKRLDRLSSLAEDSEPDLRQLQLALRGFSSSALRATDNLNQISNVATIVVPIVQAAVKRWTTETSAPDRTEADGRTQRVAPGNGVHRPTAED